MITTSSPADLPRASIWRARLLVVAGYGLLAAFFSWPLPLYIADRAVLARGADFYQHIWNLWWVKFSLLTLRQDPYYTTYLHYPGGQSLLYHVVDPLNGIISIPLQAVFGLLATFNLLRLAHLVFSATAAYALCRTLKLPPLAAWVGGALFAICPIAATSFDLGQLVEISTGWIPLYIVCLIKALGNRALGIAPSGWLWVVGGSLSLAASALSTWYFFTALVLYTILYAAWETGALLLAGRRYGLRIDAQGHRTPASDPIRNPQTAIHVYRLLAVATAIGAGAGLLLSPLLVSLLAESAKGGDYLFTPVRTVIANSADLFSFFLPAPARYNNLTVNPHGGTPALSWTVIALSLLGLATRKRFRPQEGENEQLSRAHLYFWLAAAAIFALLAMGPHLLIWGSDTDVPLPYLLLNNVPFLGAARVPIRFVLIVSLAMSVLAAYGLVALGKLVRDSIARLAAFAVVGAMIAIELVGIPRTLITPTVDPFFSAIASTATGSGGASEAVMEIPAGVRAAPSMLSQTVHQRPILEAYTARRYPYPWFDATPGVAQLARSDANALSAADIVSPPVAKTALAALDYYGVRYVAVYTTGNPGLDDRTSAVADALFGLNNIAPVSQDSTVTVYKAPPQPRDGPLVGLGSGWYGIESAGERLWRWTDGNARVQITNPTDKAMPVRLGLRAYTLDRPRTMVVTLDGRELARNDITAYPSQQVVVDADLSPGEHWIALTSLQPAVSPPGDSRKLSLGFEGISVEKR